MKFSEIPIVSEIWHFIKWIRPGVVASKQEEESQMDEDEKDFWRRMGPGSGTSANADTGSFTSSVFKNKNSRAN